MWQHRHMQNISAHQPKKHQYRLLQHFQLRDIFIILTASNENNLCQPKKKDLLLIFNIDEC